MTRRTKIVFRERGSSPDLELGSSFETAAHWHRGRGGHHERVTKMAVNRVISPRKANNTDAEG